MIQMQTNLDVADNSGARRVMMDLHAIELILGAAITRFGRDKAGFVIRLGLNSAGTELTASQCRVTEKRTKIRVSVGRISIGHTIDVIVISDKPGLHLPHDPCSSRGVRAAKRDLAYPDLVFILVFVGGDMAKAAKTIKIEQTGSAIRRHHSQRSTLIGLKLNKIGRTAELPDTPEVRGMIAKVQHIVRIVGDQ